MAYAHRHTLVKHVMREHTSTCATTPVPASALAVVKANEAPGDIRSPAAGETGHAPPQRPRPTSTEVRATTDVLAPSAASCPTADVIPDTTGAGGTAESSADGAPSASIANVSPDAGETDRGSTEGTCASLALPAINIDTNSRRADCS